MLISGGNVAFVDHVALLVQINARLVYSAMPCGHDEERMIRTGKRANEC